MFTEWTVNSLNLKLCSKQYNKIFVLQLIVVPQLSSGYQHNYSTKTRQTGHANEQSTYSLMSMGGTEKLQIVLDKSVGCQVRLVVKHRYHWLPCFVESWVGNTIIDFLIFSYHFWIMDPKFGGKVERFLELKVLVSAEFCTILYRSWTKSFALQEYHSYQKLGVEQQSINICGQHQEGF